MLELIGQIRDRKIYYCNLRFDSNSLTSVPFNNWIAFTIVDEADEDMIDSLTKKCLDQGTCYICSAGKLATLMEDYFDEEIVMRTIAKKENTEEFQDYEDAPMTSSHKNFDEGFWFATTVARQIVYDKHVTSAEVVCVDCTSRHVRQYLIDLIHKINENWLPGENESKDPLI